MINVTNSTKIDLLYNYVEKLHNICEFLFNTIIVNGFDKISSVSLSISDFFFSNKLTEFQKKQAIKIASVSIPIISPSNSPEKELISIVPTGSIIPTKTPLTSYPATLPLASRPSLLKLPPHPTKPLPPLPIETRLFENTDQLAHAQESEDEKVIPDDAMQVFDQLPLDFDKQQYIFSLLNNDCFDFFDSRGKIRAFKLAKNALNLIKTIKGIAKSNPYPNISTLAFLGTAISHSKGLLLLKTTHSLIEGTLFSKWVPAKSSIQRKLSNFVFTKILEVFTGQRERDPTAFNKCFISEFIKATNVKNSSDIDTLLEYGKIMGTPTYDCDAIKETITIIARNNRF